MKSGWENAGDGKVEKGTRQSERVRSVWTACGNSVFNERLFHEGEREKIITFQSSPLERKQDNKEGKLSSENWFHTIHLWTDRVSLGKQLLFPNSAGKITFFWYLQWRLNISRRAWKEKFSLCENLYHHPFSVNQWKIIYSWQAFILHKKHNKLSSLLFISANFTF